jgi:hypothetical protein
MMAVVMIVMMMLAVGTVHVLVTAFVARRLVGGLGVGGGLDV